MIFQMVFQDIPSNFLPVHSSHFWLQLSPGHRLRRPPGVSRNEERHARRCPGPLTGPGRFCFRYFIFGMIYFDVYFDSFIVSWVSYS